MLRHSNKIMLNFPNILDCWLTHFLLQCTNSTASLGVTITLPYSSQKDEQPWLIINVSFSAAPPGFLFFLGNSLGARPNRGSGGRSPSGAWEFSKICKSFLKKIEKMHWFPVFQKNSKPWDRFSVFGRKIQMAGKIEKFWWKFNRKLNF